MLHFQFPFPVWKVASIVVEEPVGYHLNAVYCGTGGVHASYRYIAFNGNTSGRIHGLLLHLQYGGVPIGYRWTALGCNTESCMWITNLFHSI